MSNTHDGPALILTPRRRGVAADQPTALEVLVRFQAPDALPSQPAQRHPLNLAVVLDRSGSMDGRPLAEAKRCAEWVIKSLAPSDRIALVVYDGSADVLVPSQPATDPPAICAALRGVRSGGNTALHAGWRAGVEQVQPFVTPHGLTRVLLVSDGQANAGLTAPERIAAECAAAAAAGVSTSTYGLGHSFNEDLMTRMAQLGEGQAWYGETADDLHEPFTAELALLGALYGRKVVLRVEAAPGVDLALRNAYPAVGPRAWRLPSVALGAESWALLEARVAAGVLAHTTAPIMRATIGFDDLHGERRELAASLALPVVDATAFQALPEDELVARRAGELAAAALQRRARDAARGGDWDLVHDILAEAKRLAIKSAWASEVVAALGELADERQAVRFLKEAAFAAYRMDSRLAAKHEGSVHQAEALWLKRKLRQGRAGE